MNVTPFPLDDDQKLLLATVITEYLELVEQKKQAAHLDDIRLALDISLALKQDGLAPKRNYRDRRTIVRARQEVAREVTARMTSVAERMLGL